MVVWSRYHVADILPAASKGALLALVVDAYEKGLSVGGTGTIIVLEALRVEIVLITLGIVL